MSEPQQQQAEAARTMKEAGRKSFTTGPGVAAC